MGAEDGQELTYQWLLRALGAYLDQEPSCRITLAEVPDGFLVRLQRHLHQLEPRILHFKRETLQEQLRRLMDEKRSGTSAKIRHQGIWARFPNGHQDFMRALGYELDDAKAQGILVDELEEGLVVTYSYPEEPNGRLAKRMVILGQSEIESILNAAFERRRKTAEVSPS